MKYNCLCRLMPRELSLIILLKFYPCSADASSLPRLILCSLDNMNITARGSDSTDADSLREDAS